MQPELLPTILEQMSDGFVAIDSNGFCIFANQKAAFLFELKEAEDLVGKSLLNEFAQFTEAPIDDAIKAVQSTQQPLELQAYFNALEAWYQVRIYPDAESINLYFTINSDRKVILPDIQENEKRFATIFHRSPVPTALTRISDARFSDVNEAMEQLTGYSREELIGKTSLELELYLNPAKREALADKIEDKGAYNSIEMQLRRKSGEVRHVVISSELIEFDGEQYVIALANDITLHKQAEEALELSERRFRTLVEKSFDFTILLDAEIEIFYASPSILTVLGYTAEEFIQQGRKALVHPEDFDHVGQQYAWLLENPEETINNEIRIRHKDGTWRIMKWLARNLLHDPSVNAIVSNLADITEQKQAEQALKLSEKLFSEAFHVGPAGMTITRIDDGKFIDANETFCQMFEYEREEVIGRTSVELNMWTQEERQKLIKQQIELGGLHSFELVARSKSGKNINVLFSSSEIDIRGEACHLTTLIDISDRKQAEEALELNERRFRTLIEKSSDLLLLINAEAEITYASPSIEKLLGYTAEEFSRLNRLDLVHPDDMDSLLEQAKWASENPGKALEGEHRVRHKDGSWRVFRRILRNLMDDPSVNSLVSNLTDITAYKQIEEALRESEEKYRTLVNHASDGIFVSDAQGYYVDVNKRGCDLVGYTREELIGKHISVIVAPENLQDQPLRLDELQVGKSLLSERLLNHKDGSQLLVEISSTILPDGNLQGMVRDISERKQAEEALRAREERFRLAMENIPDVVVLYDADLVIRFINRAATELTGRPVSDYIGRREEEIWSPEVYERYLPALEEALETRKIVLLEDEITLPDNNVLNVAITCVPILDSDNNVREILGITHNLTKHKQAERALQRYNQRLKILHEIDQNIITARSSEEIVDAVLEVLRQLIACKRATVTLFDEELEEVIILGTSSTGKSPVQRGERLSVKGDPRAEIIRTGQAVLVQDITKIETDGSVIGDNLLREGIHSFLITPLIMPGHFIGSLNLLSTTPDFFTDEHQKIAKEVANQLAIGLHQVHLHEQLEQMNHELEQRVIMRTDELQRSEARYRGVIETQMDMVCRYLPDGMLTFVNNTYCEHYQKKPEDLLGKIRFDLLPQEERPKLEQHIASLNIANPVASIEIPQFNSEGQTSLVLLARPHVIR